MRINKILKNIFILLTPGLLTINLLSINCAFAENLTEVYYLAIKNDPTLLGARQNQLAEAEQLIIARSKMLPSISVAGGPTYGKKSDQLYGLNNLGYNYNSYTLNINQPIFQIVDWMNYASTKKQTLSSLKKYEDVEQNLILRVAEQYFNILSAINQLETSKAAKQAFAKKLEQAAHQFKVGVAAITDLNDAQARLDSARAQKIADANALKTAKEGLSQIVGKYIDNVSLLKAQIPLIPPEPLQIELWVEKARNNNIKLQAVRLEAEAARASIKVSSSGHLPTLNAAGSITKQKYPPSSPSPVDKVKSKELALQLNVPIFSGGSQVASTQAAIFKANAVLQQLEAAYREAESSTRIAYNSVLTQISQVDALEQSVKSNKIALKANNAAFTVGTRTIVDVLNSQTDVLNAQRDHEKARYAYIINSLKLKQATGSLSFTDLEQINDLLEKI